MTYTLNGNRPTAIAALDTLSSNFALTPVNQKRPYLTNWQSIDTTRSEIAQHLLSGQADGYGIKLGIPSGGICAIDIDGTAARCKLFDIMGDEEMPITVEFASGKLDRSQYLFTIPPELWATLTTKTEKIEGEEFAFFWTGRQSVLPPSAHPETKGYFWVHSPDDTTIAPLPTKLLEYWLNLITPEQPTIPVNVPKPSKTSGDILTIPLERLLTKQHRSILSGVSQGGRNTTGASLARDLIGVAALGSIECDYRGKNYILTIEGSPEELFYNYCNGCTPPLLNGESDRIWKSAQTADREPCIRDIEILKNCGRSYLKEILSATKRQTKFQKIDLEVNESETNNSGEEYPYFTTNINEGLVYHHIVEKFGKRSYISSRIGNHLDVIAYVTNPQGKGNSIYVEFKTIRGEIKRITLMRSSLVHETSLMLADLQDIGYFFNLDRKKELINYLNQLGATIEKKYTITEQTGWFGNNYVSQTKTYSADNKSDLKFRDIEPLADPMSEIKGTLAQWCQYIGEKCAGNSRLIFGIGIALAAILQPLLGIESGGFHLVGTTSVGKTTIMKVAASVVGIEDIPQWRTTTNGLESIASAHNHMLLPLDEIGQADAKDVGAIAYMLANGQGKTRMTKKLTNQKAKTWQLLFLSSGEEGMGQYMATAGMSQKGGQEVRLPDIPAAVTGSPYGAFENIHGCSSSKEFAENLNRAAHKYHGTLLDGFLEKLVIDVVDDDFLHDRKQRLREISLKLATGTTDRAVSRVSTRFALIQVALELAHGYGLLPFPLADIEWAIQTMFMDWLNSRGGDGSVEMRAAINRIQHLLVTNEFSDRVYTLPDNNDRVVRNLLGYRKLDASGSTEEFWIPPSVFEKEFCENMDKSELIKELQRLGLMIPARSDGKPRHQRKINSKPSYYYIFQTIKVPEAAEAAELPPSIVDTASVPPLPAPLPTTGSAEAVAQFDGLELPLPTLPMTGSGAEAMEDVLNPYISTSHTPASTASDASGEKTSNLELMVNDRAILTSTKEEGLVIATRTHQYQTPKSGLKTVHQCLVEFEAGDRKWLDTDILVLTPKSSPRSI